MVGLPRRAVPALFLCSLLAISLSHADDEVQLSVTHGSIPGEIRLDWDGGLPNFRVYRSTTAPHMVNPSNEVGLTSGRVWIETPPAGDIFFYRVMGPCITPSAERCDGVDDDCNNIVDDGCGPCQSDSDCDAFDAPSVCNDAATCQGARSEGECDAASQCVAASVPDDSACAGLPSSDCGPYPGITCTAAAVQPVNQDSLCPSSCSLDSQCDSAGHCDEIAGVCLDDFPAGFGCVAADDCTSGHCVDGVCCTSGCTGTCSACDVAATIGTCGPIPNGQDPGSECGAQSCTGFYFGFVGDTCYRKADVSSAQAACGGDSACRNQSEECAAQTVQGPNTITCHDLCQNPTAGTCTGTTAGSCTNVSAGNHSCGLGACLRTVPRCVNGAPNTCVPGTPTTETCNDFDDNCDGVTDNGPFSDTFEPNASCGSASVLATVGSDQTREIATPTIYPAGDVDWYRINATETDSTCGCGPFSFDEDYRLHVTLEVPPGAGSYNFCTYSACGGTPFCQEAAAEQSIGWIWSFDGACGGGTDAYSLWVSIAPQDQPGFECRPYKLTYRFESGLCF